MKRILVTGANGFVGSALCAALSAEGRRPLRAVRTATGDPGEIVVGNLGPDTDWSRALHDVDCVVHLAARTHVLDERSCDPLTSYRLVNVLATRALARDATRHGVRRVVFLSSVKVNGESTADQPFRDNDAPAPLDAYGITKLEAEHVLEEMSASGGPAHVVLRPPLVYGPGVKGNFLRLLNLVARGVPLPFGSVRNRRSLICVGNLVDALIAAIDSPAASGNHYLVSDGSDVSTPELLRAISAALDVPSRVFPFPLRWLELAARAAGRRAEFARLAGSLQIDPSRGLRDLGWTPRRTLQDGLRETAEWYRACKP